MRSSKHVPYGTLTRSTHKPLHLPEHAALGPSIHQGNCLISVLHALLPESSHVKRFVYMCMLVQQRHPLGMA